MDGLGGSLVCFDAHLPRPGWSGEDLRLPTGQRTLTALWTGEGEGGEGGNGRKIGGGEIFNKKAKNTQNKQNKTKKEILVGKAVAIQA